MNVKLLQKVKKHILAEPSRLRMAGYSWIVKPGTFLEPTGYCNDLGQIVPKCGAVGCIAGWATGLGGGDMEHANCETGARHLGLDVEFGDRLFFVSRWPNSFSLRYLKAETLEEKAKITAGRIDHFIATKGAE